MIKSIIEAMLIFKARNVCIVQNTRQNQKPDKIWFCSWIALNMCVWENTHAFALLTQHNQDQ